MSGASVVHTTSDYDIDGMNTARGSGNVGPGPGRADGQVVAAFDNHWIIDSTPVECGRSRPTVQRSDLAGWAGYGYCASHSRFFRGLRLYLVCAPTGMPILWSLANPKLAMRGAELLQRPARPGTTRRPDLEGVAVRVAQRVLALAAAIWHHHKTGQPITRSPIAYDH